MRVAIFGSRVSQLKIAVTVVNQLSHRDTLTHVFSVFSTFIVCSVRVATVTELMMNTVELRLSHLSPLIVYFGP